MTKTHETYFIPDEWLSGTRSLTAEERGCYATVCILICQNGGPVNDNPQEISSLCNVNISRWIKLRDALVHHEKIQIIDGKIHQLGREFEMIETQEPN